MLEHGAAAVEGVSEAQYKIAYQNTFNMVIYLYAKQTDESVGRFSF